MTNPMAVPGLDEGVWGVYYYDVGPNLSSVHMSEIDALRVAVRDHSYVVFIEWGQSLGDAIKAATP